LYTVISKICSYNHYCSYLSTPAVKEIINMLSF